tara:strand:+ start:1363 stop:1617 length:255 start_codon:yes stop_codon:yes gene_type:complete
MDVENKLYEILKNEFAIEKIEITARCEDVGLDSLDMVELATYIEEEFEIEIKEELYDDMTMASVKLEQLIEEIEKLLENKNGKE